MESEEGEEGGIELKRFHHLFLFSYDQWSVSPIALHPV